MNNPSLLEIIPFPKKGKIQAFAEIPVSPETAPYLVSSSKSLVWVKKPRPRNVVWAAVRVLPPEELFRDIILAILDKIQEEGWGSIFKQTEVDQACLRLCEYDLPEIELLVDEEFPLEGVNIAASPVSWLPKGYAVIVPSNRAFLGSVLDLGKGEIAALVHNAARGIAILAP